MIYEEDRADQCASHVLLLTSDPVFKEQIKGIIVRIGGAVKVISRMNKYNQIRDKQYPSVPIGGCENEQRDSNADMLQCSDRFPNSSQSIFVEDPPPTTIRLIRTVTRSFFRPVLHTVFSTTRLGHVITQLVFIRSRIWECIPPEFIGGSLLIIERGLCNIVINEP